MQMTVYKPELWPESKFLWPACFSARLDIFGSWSWSGPERREKQTGAETLGPRFWGRTTSGEPAFTYTAFKLNTEDHKLIQYIKFVLQVDGEPLR